MNHPVSLIVAMARNRTIGRGNDLPWHIPEDLKYFKSVTRGKPVIMGRKTFDSIISRIGKPLPDRPNYVISRTPPARSDIIACLSLEDAIAKAKADHPDQEIVIMGGASIYEQALDLVDRMYLTVIDADIEGDAWFPVYDERDWKMTESTASASNGWTYEFRTLNRSK